MPVLAIIAISLVLLTLISLISGAVGRSILGDINLPSWIIIDQPHPELPPEEVFSLFGLPVTNTMIGAWMSILVLGLIFWAATRRMKMLSAGCSISVQISREKKTGGVSSHW